MENIITRMMAGSKGAGTAILKAELEDGLQKFTIVYTDGSVGNTRRNEDQIGGTNVHIQR
jgi:hypothetical protein